MAYQLREINSRIRQDTPAFLAQCDRAYQDRVRQAADLIVSRMDRSPIVLLSGPSGSGKTTTAMKIEEELEKRGVSAHTISLDNYFIALEEKDLPLTETGQVDFESPAFLDMPLLDQTFTRLSRGQEVMVPKFDFARQLRDESMGRPLRLQEREIAIFEGIHALLPAISGPHPEATRIYISPYTELWDGDRVLFTGPMLRLSRRILRDHNFRGMSPAQTLDMWDTVCRGEGLYIDPYRDSAHLKLDTTLPYEVSVLKTCTLPLLEELDGGSRSALAAAFDGFEAIDPDLVDTCSLLREFVGGSSYQYH